MSAVDTVSKSVVVCGIELYIITDLHDVVWVVCIVYVTYADHLPRTIYHGPSTTDHLPWTINRRTSTADHLPRTIYRGTSTVEHLPRTIYRGLTTADQLPRTIYRGPSTEDDLRLIDCVRVIVFF